MLLFLFRLIKWLNSTVILKKTYKPILKDNKSEIMIEDNKYKNYTEENLLDNLVNWVDNALNGDLDDRDSTRRSAEDLSIRLRESGYEKHSKQIDRSISYFYSHN